LLSSCKAGRMTCARIATRWSSSTGTTSVGQPMLNTGYDQQKSRKIKSKN
jgi:hypothetical protein